MILALAGTNAGHGTALRDAVCVLCVGKIGDGHAVDGLQRDAAVILRAAPEACGHNVFRHTLPETQGRCNACCTLVIGVVVGKAEHPDSGAVKCPCAVTWRGEAGITGRLQLIVAERFLVDPVDILLCIERRDVLIAVVKAVFFGAGGAALRLFVDRRMDQVVARCRKADRLHHWFRFLFGFGRFLRDGACGFLSTGRKCSDACRVCHRDRPLEQKTRQAGDAQQNDRGGCPQCPERLLFGPPLCGRAAAGRGFMLIHGVHIFLRRIPAFRKDQRAAIMSPMLYRPGSFFAR